MYRVELNKSAEKELSKLDSQTQKIILTFLEQDVESENPRLYGKVLKYNWAGHWRYDLGKYRIICKIKDDVCIVLVIKIGHRREIYRKN